MANYVSNYVSVSGATADVQAFVEKAKQPYTYYYQTKDYKVEGRPDIEAVEELNSEMLFWNFLRPTDDELPYYFGRKKQEKPEGYESMDFSGQYTYDINNGLEAGDWNRRNWGISHDIWRVENFDEGLPVNGRLSVSYSFETKWSIPEGAFKAMVEQHPELDFYFESEEETGWGAEYSGEGGEFTLTKDWDSPECHEDYAERDRECSMCEGGWEENPNEWFDDCPTKAVEVIKWNNENGISNTLGATEEPNLIY